MEKLIYIGFGGFLGANTRYMVSVSLVNWLSTTLGWQSVAGTIFVNVTGSFLLGVFISLTQRIILPENTRLLVATGFFGAYTTFSTFANESVAMLREGDWWHGLSNIIVTNALCLLGALLGILIASRLWSST